MPFFTKQIVHPSWMIATVSAGFLFGIAISVLGWTAFFASLWWALFGISLVTVSLIWRMPVFICLAAFGGILCGLWRGADDQTEIHKYQMYMGRVVQVSGDVSEDVEKGNSGELKLKIKNVRIEGKNLPGEVWVSAATRLGIKRSDRVVAEGKLRAGFGSFPASMTYARLVRAERPEGVDIARDARDQFSDHVRLAVAEPAASLGIGFVTGQKSTLSPDLDEQLRIAGLTHLVVASGSNLTILVRFARRAFARLSKFMSTMLAGGLVAGFILVTGFSPSMSRAGLVAGLSLLCWYYGRSMHPFVLLPFAAAITVAINPLFLWGDIGWYLSFAAFFGVIILAPLIHHAVWGRKKAGLVRQIIVDTLSAQIVTTPIIAFSFGTYSVYAIVANMLVLPLIPLAMVLTFLTGICALVFAPFGIIAGAPTQLLLDYMVWVARFVSELPGAEGEVAFDMGWLVASYAVICGVCVFLWCMTRHDFRGDNLVE